MDNSVIIYIEHNPEYRKLERPVKGVDKVLDYLKNFAQNAEIVEISYQNFA